MKKFFTNISLQGEGQLQSFVYEPRGNERLRMAEPTSFPIIPAINGYVSPGEEFRVIAVVQNNENAERNYGILKDELRALCDRKGLAYPARGIERIPGPDTQTVSENIDTFQRLIDLTEDEDELFACVTYGHKPMSMALLTAVRYAYRLKKNTIVSCVVFGEVDIARKKAYICDETALVQLDEITRILSGRGVSNPKAIIDGILKL